MAAVDRCYISADVYLVCMHHALTTEVEEIMGLLIGYTDEVKRSCHISHTLMLKRLDKRKDRVEISPELLSSSITVCEELNKERASARMQQNQLQMQGQNRAQISSDRFDAVLKRDGSFNEQIQPPIDDENEPYLRVVGWYHSHPHITVFPSDVDLRTQEQYQSGADPMWIGLIFGVYNSEEMTGVNHFQHIAFQSIHGGSNQRLMQHLIPLIVVSEIAAPIGITISNRAGEPVPSQKTLNNLESSFSLLIEEEYEAYQKAKGELDRSSSAPRGAEPGDLLARQQINCILSKNICKLVSLLATPLLDVLRELRRPHSPPGGAPTASMAAPSFSGTIPKEQIFGAENLATLFKM